MFCKMLQNSQKKLLFLSYFVLTCSNCWNYRGGFFFCWLNLWSKRTKTHQNSLILNVKVSVLDLICLHAKGFQPGAMNCSTKISRMKEKQNNNENARPRNTRFCQMKQLFFFLKLRMNYCFTDSYYLNEYLMNLHPITHNRILHFRYC